MLAIRSNVILQFSNVLFAIGFLALPSSFYDGGILTSTAVLCFVGYLMIVSCTWEGRYVMQCSRVLQSIKVPEVTETFRIFCGTKWRDAYAIILSVSLLSCSWVLAILFGHTLASSLPSIYHGDTICHATDNNDICTTRYNINIFILAVLTTPLALMDISEQWYIQNSLTVIRVLRMLLMCITPMIATTQEAMRESFPLSFPSDVTVTPPPLVFGNWHGVCLVLSASVFGLFLNANVPIIIDSLADRNKYTTVLYYAFSICMLLYVWLSIVISFQFGSSIENPCNLNWTGFRWVGGGDCALGSFCDLSARAVEFIVVFCPAIDVASAYPFISIVLGNSMTEIIVGVPANIKSSSDVELSIHSVTVNEVTPLTNREEKNYGDSNDILSISFDNDNDNETNNENDSELKIQKFKKVNKILRFVMNTLPLVLSVTVANFSIVIQLTGAISVLICLVFPAYLSLKCNSYMSHYNSIRNAINGDYISWLDMSTVLQEVIEKPLFKWIFLWMGVVTTLIILYISLAY